MEQKNGRKRGESTRILILLLVLITAIAVAVTIWALFFRKTAPVLAPDYAPVEAEVYAVPIEDESKEDKMEADQGGGAVSMTYQKNVTISLAENTAKLMFQNPSKSVNDMVLQLIIVSSDGTETVIAQSGSIKPGNKIDQLDLIEGAASLSEGTYNGKFNVLYYDPDSGEKAIVNGSVEGISITVTQ
ncbi:MAG: hypothetical protein Q4E24_04630 [bacterium]|nr:hypothetical protein [bacterium]